MEHEPASQTREESSLWPLELEAQLALCRKEISEAAKNLSHSEALRHDAAAAQHALKAELQHRVRNMLATIRTVFARTMESAASLQEATDHFSGRLDALARYQEMLAWRPHSLIDLETLVRDELLTFGFGDGDRVTIQGSSVHLTEGIVAALGLAIHELATNAMKFGALSPRGGNLTVTWQIDSQDPETLRIEWLETGVAMVASAPLRIGFGRDFIEFGLPYQIDATTMFELRPGGLKCSIALPRAGLIL